MRLPLSRALGAPGEPRGHQGLAVGVEPGERLQGVECGRSVDVGVVGGEVAADLQGMALLSVCEPTILARFACSRHG